MQGFDKLPRFSRALRASHVARAAGNPFAIYTDGLQFAEGMLFAVALVSPFWILVGYAISLAAR